MIVRIRTMPFSGAQGKVFLRQIIAGSLALYGLVLIFGLYSWIEQGNSALQGPVLIGLGSLQTLVSVTIGYVVKREQSEEQAIAIVRATRRKPPEP